MKKIREPIDEFIRNAANNLEFGVLIYDNEHGYMLFDRYQIFKESDYVTAERLSDGKRIDFSSVKHAATWCILDRYNKILEAKRVIEIDQFLTSINAETIQHKRLQKIGNLETKEINRDKYLRDIDRQKRFQWEIDKYIKMAKKCQNKGYQNELTRTSGK